MVDRNNVVAIGLLAETSLKLLGQGFQRGYQVPVDEQFWDLPVAVDTVDDLPQMPSPAVIKAGASGP